jgi:peptidyl-prolyl cis-trans isomerase C
MFNKSRILLVGAASVLALSACKPGDANKTASAPDGAKDSVVATVNGVDINRSRVDLVVKQQAARGAPDTPELRKAIVENLTLQLLLSQEAGKKGLDKLPETATQVEMAKQSILANAFVQDYMKTAPVTDEMLKAEYEKVKAARSGTEYKARHILVKDEAAAKDIIAKLKKDVKAFEALAKEKTQDPGSKETGGDLGWFSPQTMVPEFGAAVAKLEKGKFTEEPVKSQFGYHVILLEDSRPIQAPPLEQVKEQLKQPIQQANLKKFFEELKAKAKIENVAAEPVPATPPVGSASSPAAAAHAGSVPPVGGASTSASAK